MSSQPGQRDPSNREPDGKSHGLNVRQEIVLFCCVVGYGAWVLAIGKTQGWNENAFGGVALATVVLAVATGGALLLLRSRPRG